MSRVHLKYEPINVKNKIIGYDVISSDFNEELKRERIGEIKLNSELNDFTFKPIERLKGVFCPPEYFKEYNGDYKLTELKAIEGDFYYLDWAYLIYKKALDLVKE